MNTHTDQTTPTTRGCFITIEGIEGAGKSTAVQRVSQILGQHQITHQRTREPGGTPYAESIRQLLISQPDETVDKHTELLLMFASRAQHVREHIEPTLASGQWLICDRFTDSSYAYQGGGRQIDTTMIAMLEKMVHPHLQPDLTLLMDVDPATGAKRIANRSHDRIEQEQTAFFTAAREAYLQRAQAFPERFVVIDANRVLSKIKSDIQDAITALIERKK